MLCPQCNGEFVIGVNECPDCAVALVEPTPSSFEPDASVDRSWRTIWEVTSGGELSVVTSLLESNGIPVRAPGQTIFGLVLAYQDRQAAKNQIWPPLRKPEPTCEVQVPADHAEEAIAILEAEPERVD